jgi:hypothetical protein
MSRKVKKEEEKKEPEVKEPPVKPSTDLAIAHKGIPESVFVAMDKADEEQIVEELTGMLDYAKDLVYQATIGGRAVTALSYKGIKQAIHETIHNKGYQYVIKEGYPKRLDRPEEDSIMIEIVVSNPVLNVEFAGAAQCEKTDKFALAKATSKAQRNALKSFIPEGIYAKVVEEYIKKRKVKVIDMKPVTIPTVQPRSVVEPKVQPTTQPAGKLSEQEIF